MLPSNTEKVSPLLLWGSPVLPLVGTLPAYVGTPCRAQCWLVCYRCGKVCLWSGWDEIFSTFLLLSCRDAEMCDHSSLDGFRSLSISHAECRFSCRVSRTVEPSDVVLPPGTAIDVVVVTYIGGLGESPLE